MILQIIVFFLGFHLFFVLLLDLVHLLLPLPHRPQHGGIAAHQDVAHGPGRHVRVGFQQLLQVLPEGLIGNPDLRMKYDL